MNHTLITGATSGIGEALARIFAREKKALVLVSRDSKKLEKLANELRKTHGIPVQIFAANLAETNSARKVYDYVIENDLKIDTLVNNAGVGDFGEFHLMNEKKIDDMIELNVNTLTKLTRALLPQMVKRKSGKILNLASTASFQPGPMMAAYFATKAYVLNFSLAIAKELEGTGVTVTALCPGPTISSFSHAASVSKSKLFASKSLPSATEVAEFGFLAMNAGKKVAVHGTANRIKAFLIKFLTTERQLIEIEKMMKQK